MKLVLALSIAVLELDHFGGDLHRWELCRFTEMIGRCRATRTSMVVILLPLVGAFLVPPARPVVAEPRRLAVERLSTRADRSDSPQ